MIWTAGRIVPDEALAIGVADRTFEHGLGLFETFRTWNGRPALLPRHLDRMTQSARELGVPLDPKALPDAAAISALLAANRAEGDARFRLTMTGGTSADGGAVVWMRPGPLPPAVKPEVAVLLLSQVPVCWDDPLVRHKTLNYWARRIAFEQAQALGADEAVMATADGRIWEATRTNLFLVRGQALATPGLDGPVLPGVMRAAVLDAAQRLGISASETDLTYADLDEADEVFLTNSVRGIVPVGRTPRRVRRGPGPISQRLWQEVERGLLGTQR